VTFSSSAQVACGFTRDYTQILNTFSSDKEQKNAAGGSNLEQALNAVSDLVMEEYGCFIACQVLLVTSNVDTVRHEASLSRFCSRLAENRLVVQRMFAASGVEYDEAVHYSSSIINQEAVKSSCSQAAAERFLNCKYPFSFPNRFDVICLRSETLSSAIVTRRDEAIDGSRLHAHLNEFEEENFRQKEVSKRLHNSLQKEHFLNELVKMNGASSSSLTGGKVFAPHSLDASYIENEFTRNVFGQIYLNSAVYQLRFGELESSVILSPSPLPYKGFDFYYFLSLFLIILILFLKNFQTA
jgi:hypothetical protein